MKEYAIGADIGGSHISAIIMDLETKKILTEHFASCKVDNRASADNILERWKNPIEKILGWIDIEQLAGIGFAMPGPFDYEQGIARFTTEVAKYENLNGVNISNYMKNKLNLRQEIPVRFMNDATSFAVGEAWIGKTSDHFKSIAITLGTGFGSAFIESGIPVLEREDIPKMGCLWHIPFKNGIADDYFSTRWCIKRYAELSGETMTGVKEITEQTGKNSLVNALFEEFGTNLAEFIAPWIEKFEPESIVIGGNIAKAWDLSEKAFMSNLNIKGLKIDIHLSELGETAAMVGSARLMDESFWVQVKPLLSKM